MKKIQIKLFLCVFFSNYLIINEAFDIKKSKCFFVVVVQLFQVIH